MTTSGPISLMGGREHFPGSEPIDRRLLEEVGVSHPRVAIIPVAPTPRQLPPAAALARNHWRRLGAEVKIVDPAQSAPAEEMVAGADVVVLPGGHPNRLVAALAPSPLWDRVVERWRQGAGISGSSAGAMALFEWRLRLYPPNPLALLPGLGLFSGYLAAPHFDRFRAERWANRVDRRLDGLGVIGLDEGTALVGRGDRFTVIGRRSVTIVSAGATRTFQGGTEVRLSIHAEFEPFVVVGRQIEAPMADRHAATRPLHPVHAAVR